MSRAGPLREAHAHLHHLGRERGFLHLGACGSRDEALARIAARAGAMAGEDAGRWLVACGARPEGWAEPGWPGLRELDAACPDRPCLVASFDHHAAQVNTRGLSAAGIGARTPDPDGGVIVRDARGAVTGVLLESAYRQAWRAVPEPSAGEWRDLVREAVMELAGLGYGEIHDLLSPAWLGPVLADLDDAGALPATVWLYPALAELPGVAAGRARWERPRVRLAGGKVFADGTLNSRTAWTLTAYADPLPGRAHGEALMRTGDLASAMERAASLGVGLAVHAIGDGAVRAALDAWERVAGSRGFDRGARGYAVASGVERGSGAALPALRIEHAEVIDAADVPRFARLGVVCSVQPCHLLADIEALTRSMPHRLERVLPLRELIDAGCAPGGLLWFGSDVPIVGADPRDSIQAAVRRRRAGMPESGAIAPGQAIREEEAWGAFTRAAGGGGVPGAARGGAGGRGPVE